MVAIKPVDSRRAAEICARLHQPCGDDRVVMEATASGEYVGSAIFRLCDRMLLDYVDYTAGDDGLCDLIVRAAMNYAINREVDKCVIGPMCPLDTFVRLGYIQLPLPADISIIALFTGCRGCNKQEE